MRAAVLVPLLILTGCSTMRDAVGKYGAFAERGINLQPVIEATAPAPQGGLAGDGKAHTYSEAPPRSS